MLLFMVIIQKHLTIIIYNNYTSRSKCDTLAIELTGFRLQSEGLQVVVRTAKTSVSMSVYHFNR